MTAPTTATADREIAATRIFDAPRELVWRVWTDPDHIGKWWGPIGFTTSTNVYELKPGGKWLFVMHGPDGTDYRNDVTFTDVVEPERLEYDHGPSPIFHVTVRFDVETDDKTKLSMQMLFPTAEERDRTIEKFGAIEGLNQTLGRLTEYLTTMRL
ncbi:MAG TPA: SRPBCC family protein [Pyrinomonadaceae bacterium]|jgi:uncharacterized protein YndB with AHSA1/START domain|nr:SRPBCC family protein [Pyrinomonadaceae bacterium]